MEKVIAILLAAVSAAPALAGIPVVWTTDTYKVKPLAYRCYHGETLDLAATLTAYGEPLALGGETARLYWQTNGMGSAWWVTNATVRVDSATGATNVLAATFAGAYDTGAAEVTGFIGVEGKNYRAAFTLAFLDSPGFSPNALPLPPATIDWAAVTNLNVESAPFAIRGQGGVDTNAVREIAASASVTNAGAVAEAKAYADGKFVANIDGYSTNGVWGAKHELAIGGGLGAYLYADGIYFYTDTNGWNNYVLFPPVGSEFFSLLKYNYFDIFATRQWANDWMGGGTVTNGGAKAYADALVVHTNPTFSNEVLAVGLNIGTNEVAQINAILNEVGETPIGQATTVGGLLLALAAAVAWLKRKTAEIETNVGTAATSLSSALGTAAS